MTENDNVINLFEYKKEKEKLEDKETDLTSPKSLLSFLEIIQENKRKQKQRAEDRKIDNEKVKRSYRLSSRKKRDD